MWESHRCRLDLRTAKGGVRLAAGLATTPSKTLQTSVAMAPGQYSGRPQRHPPRLTAPPRVFSVVCPLLELVGAWG
jgi:hypothetical protein